MDWTMKIPRRAPDGKATKSPRKETSSPKTEKRSSDAVAPAITEPFALKIRIESPPLVAFGPPEDSSGALMSGILELYPLVLADPASKTFEVAKLELKLLMEVTTRRPISQDCPACATRSKMLHKWVMIGSRKTLLYNNGAAHDFPFSFLVPGNLPATTHSALAIVSYKLVAEVSPVPPSPNVVSTVPGGAVRPNNPKRPDSFKPVRLFHPLVISRSILPSTEPKQCHRIFPPTTLSAMLTLPTVMYPGTLDNSVDVTISGLNIPDSKRRWSLRKLTWRIDEHAKVVSPVCARHAIKIGGMKGKGILYEDTRVLGTGSTKSGWKTDTCAGKVEMAIQVGTLPGAMAACHVDAMSGVHVSHALVVECVVAEEMPLATHGGRYQPTGNDRVLRMTFPMIITERAGMGIAWDEEIPPRYEDVAWNAPPTFDQSEGGSSDAHDPDSNEELEAVDGIRRPRSRSPAFHNRPESSGSLFRDRVMRTDSNTSNASSTRLMVMDWMSTN
jgi:arrestin-related trafficking adapter 1